MYSSIRIIHITAVCLSGAFFIARAAAAIGGANWPYLKPIRILSASIDSILLSAAITLYVILPKEIFSNNWLLVKIILVLLYIAAGTLAMKQANSKPVRIGFFIVAAIIFTNIILIARAHNPNPLLF